LGIVAAWLSLSGGPLYLTAAGIAISGAASLAHAVHRSAAAAECLELHPDGRAAWRDRRGRWHDTRLGADQFVSDWLVVVCLARSMLRRKWIVVLPDSAASEQFRRLRVWLRWYREPANAKAEPGRPD